MVSKWKQEYPYLLFVVPAFLIYTLLTIVPAGFTLVFSFTDWDGMAHDWNFVGFANYTNLFEDRTIFTSLKNSLFFGLLTPIAVTIFAIPLALLLNGKMKTRSFQRAVFFFPSVISSLFIGYVWGFFLNPTADGVVNHMLIGLGFDPILWLADKKLAMVSLYIVYFWSVTGWHACLYIANLQTIPSELYEAAEMDGAGKWKKFVAITFPMLAPSMTISIMLLLTGGLKVFDLPFALTGGGPGYSTTMITQSIISVGMNAHQIGYASSLSLSFFVIIAVITVTQLKLMKKREEMLQ